MSIFSAPFYSLFSTGFYKNVQRAKLSKGVLYLFYLAVIVAILMLFFFTSRIVPDMDEFVDWAKTEMPQLTWTPDGFQMIGQNAYTMVHPEFGPIMSFDMTRVEVTEDTMGDVLVFVTQKVVYVRQGPGNLRTYDATQLQGPQQPGGIAAQPGPFQITDDFVQRVYDNLKPWLSFFVVAVSFFVFLVWKFLAALFYSWIGLLINLSRKPKLEYTPILNTAFFALTPVVVINLLQLMIPVLGKVPFGIIGGFIVTTLYMFFAISKTQEPSAQAPTAS